MWDKPLYMFPHLWRYVAKMTKMGGDTLESLPNVHRFGRKRDIGRQGYYDSLVY
jgi:hypothetical protein